MGEEGHMPASLRRAVHGLSWLLAVAGGLALVIITITTDTSIIGRALIPFGLKPVPGDFEIVEMGTAFAIFAFLPWCQLNRGHATVDIFTSGLPAPVLRTIDVIVDLVFFVIVAFIIWRTGIGLMDKYGNGQVTFILQKPVWWTYAAGMIGGVAWVIVCLYCLAESVMALVRGGEPASKEVGS